MTIHYTPKTFLRQTSNCMLQSCFNRIGALHDIPWSELSEHRIDVVYDGWQQLPDAQRLEIERGFEEAEALANEEGLKALIEEGQFHGLDLAAELEPFSNFRDKALHVWLTHPRVFEVAGTINHAHSLPMRYWKHRGGMPLAQPDVTPEGIERFRTAISAYFRNNEGRGHHCTVDAYLRVNRYHYFFAYPDDYADTYLGHDEHGHFIRRPQRPAFEVVFLFDPVDGTFDVYAQGGKVVHESLQTIFTRTLLREELPPESAATPPYQLNVLKTREFLAAAKDRDPEDGVEEVQIRKLRLSVLGLAKRRIVLEADPEGGPSAIYNMIDECLNRQNLPDALFNVTFAQLHFRFVHTGQGRQRTLTFDVSHPNSSNLKSCRNEQLRLIGEKYLRRWNIDCA
ncbi:MAG: hypothetical protein EXQ69_06050 [Acidimicrobiia bacterium]|nr:hypothetical protein [Acidimicrobiia bacterium]